MKKRKIDEGQASLFKFKFMATSERNKVLMLIVSVTVLFGFMICFNLSFIAIHLNKFSFLQNVLVTTALPLNENLRRFCFGFGINDIRCLKEADE